MKFTQVHMSLGNERYRLEQAITGRNTQKPMAEIDCFHLTVIRSDKINQVAWAWLVKYLVEIDFLFKQTKFEHIL